MERTKKRAIATGEISLSQGLFFAACLLLAGIVFLSLFTTSLALFAALTGFFVYVVLYSYAKHKTPVATLIGSISGAIPPVVGYFAVQNQIDMPAVLLFLIVGFWQMPHFYAISLFRKEDYKQASTPVLPLVKGALYTKLAILWYIAAFLVAVVALWFLNFAGWIYVSVMLPLTCFWLYVGFQGFSKQEDAVWGKKMFRHSLEVICVLSVLISVDYMQ